MVETLKGIILRETPIGDYDKMMTVLTADGGKLSVFAKGAKRLKSPLFAATQLFSYTEMTLKKTGNTYYIRTGDLIENFYHIRDTLEGAALAGYIADIASDIAIEGQEAVKYGIIDEVGGLDSALSCLRSLCRKHPKKPKNLK